jgi:hypothetical protein
MADFSRMKYIEVVKETPIEEVDRIVHEVQAKAS